MRAQEAWALMTAEMPEAQVVNLIERVDQAVTPGMCTGQFIGSTFALLALRAKRMSLRATEQTMMEVIVSSKGARAGLDPVRDAAELAFLDFYVAAAGAPLARMNDDRKLLNESITAIDNALASGALPKAMRIPAACCAVSLRQNRADLLDDIGDYERVIEQARRGLNGLKFDLNDIRERYAYMLLCNALGAALMRVGVERRSADVLMESVSVFASYLVQARGGRSVMDQFTALLGLGKAYLNIAIHCAIEEVASLERAKAVITDAIALAKANPEVIGDAMADGVLALAKVERELLALKPTVLH